MQIFGIEFEHCSGLDGEMGNLLQQYSHVCDAVHKLHFNVQIIEKNCVEQLF